MFASSNQNPAGRDLSVQFNVIENVFEGLDQFKAELVLVNNGTETLRNNWSVYFNFLRMILPESVGNGFQIQHINGDFFCLEPASSYKPLAPKARIAIPFVANNWAIKAIDSPVGFYIVYRDAQRNELTPEPISALSVGPFTRIEQVVRDANDHWPTPTAGSRFDQCSRLHVLRKMDLTPVTPTPVFIQNGKGVFQLKQSHCIAFAPHVKAEAQYLAHIFEDWFGLQIAIVEGQAGDIRLDTGHVEVNGKIEKRGREAYSVTVNSDGIEIIGTEEAGVFYGIQTLMMLLETTLRADATTILEVPVIEIRDVPGFGYRGMQLDVGRNFHSTDSIRKLLDMMAFYKLNKFHFHLTDDEGWRIEIPGLPELTEVGGRRGHTYTESDCLLPSYGSGPDPNDPASAGNGFYSRQEFVELLRYAHGRHIEVIPAIDFPGHARAAVRAMEVRYERYQAAGDMDKANQYLLTDWDDASEYESVQMWRRNVVNIGLSSTYHFIEKVVDELLAMYAAADVKLSAIHIGGDEVPNGVWIKSPACRKLMEANQELEDAQDLADYFLKQVNHILESKGVVTAGWEEIALTHKHGIRKPNPAFLDHQLLPYVWNSIWGAGGEETVYALANAGYNVVMSNANNLYFDFAYDKDPEEAGYYWGGYVNTENTFKFLPFDFYSGADRDLFGNAIDAGVQYKNSIRLTETGRSNILGIQGQLWGETIRTPERIEYLLFPRMIALAERAWSKNPEWANLEEPRLRQAAYAEAWNEFANRLGQIELPRLDALFGGVRYRIPLPGAKVERGVLTANVEFPGLAIRYTTDGTEPTRSAKLYTNPVHVDCAVVKLKTFSSNGRSSRTTVVILDGSENPMNSAALWQERSANILRNKKT